MVVGGIRAMARLHTTTASTVSGWRERGCIPGARLKKLNDEIKAGRLKRTLDDGTVVEITQDDLIEAASPASALSLTSDAGTPTQADFS